MPGMDGTGLLFRDFAHFLRAEVQHDVVRYPPSDVLGYDELLQRVTVPDGDIAIVAESFSGPLAIRLAARLGERVRALVLVATFARPPSLLVAPAALCGSLIFRVPPPRAALRTFLLGPDSSDVEVDALRRVIRGVAPAVMAKRLREIAEVDVRHHLDTIRCPVLYLRGSRDRVVTESSVDDIRAGLPALAVETVDAPHLVLQRRPEETGRLVSEFVLSSGGRDG